MTTANAGLRLMAVPSREQIERGQSRLGREKRYAAHGRSPIGSSPYIRRAYDANVTAETLILAALFFVAALLYASVGHAGASAYLAAMALVGAAAETMRPTALVLNLFVATIVIIRFARAGHLPWRSLWPLAAGSVPMAFIGGCRS